MHVVDVIDVFLFVLAGSKLASMLAERTDQRQVVGLIKADGIVACDARAADYLLRNVTERMFAFNGFFNRQFHVCVLEIPLPDFITMGMILSRRRVPNGGQGADVEIMIQ